MKLTKPITHRILPALRRVAEHIPKPEPIHAPRFATRPSDWFFFLGGLALAIALRYYLFDRSTPDVAAAFGPLFRMFKHQGFSQLKRGLLEYTPLFNYLLLLSAKLFSNLKAIVAIKLIATACDFLAAFIIYKIVRLKYPSGSVPMFAFWGALFLPTVFINSAMWGQNDILYTTGLLACLYFALKQRDYLTWISFGIAFSLKPHALCLAPFLAALALKRHLAWYKAWVVPAIYLLTTVPAWLAGRPLMEMLFISNGYMSRVFLSNNAPTVFVWFPKEVSGFLMTPALIFGVAMLFLFVFALYKSQFEFSQRLMVMLASLSVLFVPFFLPKMHDRYFFPADLFSFVLVFFEPRLFWVAVIIQLSSLFSYMPYLFRTQVIPLEYLALGLLASILTLTWSLAKQMSWKGSQE